MLGFFNSKTPKKAAKVIEVDGAIGKLTITRLARYGSATQAPDDSGFFRAAWEMRGINPFTVKCRLLELSDRRGRIRSLLIVGSTSIRAAEIKIPVGWHITTDLKGTLAGISKQLFGERLFGKSISFLRLAA